MNPAVNAMLHRYKSKSLDDQERALKEIIQEIALLGLWRAKFFEHAAFYGGSALRIFHGLERFSEDLDFSLLSTIPDFSLAKYLTAIKEELSAFGFNVTVEIKNKSTQSAISSAFIKGNTQVHLIKVGSLLKTQKDRVLKIKLEVDTEPPLGAKTEAFQALLPIPYSVRLYDLPSLFAGKLHAALCRQRTLNVKGRDWFDFLWYVGRNIPVNLEHLESRLRQSGHYSAQEPLSQRILQSLLQEKINSLDLQVLKADIRPFISDPQSIDAWSKELFLHAIGQIAV